jgi:hypothetical protein
LCELQYLHAGTLFARPRPAMRSRMEVVGSKDEPPFDLGVGFLPTV